MGASTEEDWEAEQNLDRKRTLVEILIVRNIIAKIRPGFQQDNKWHQNDKVHLTFQD